MTIFRHLAKAWLSTVHHYEFLADPRTKRVIGEPNANNPGIMALSYAVTMHVEAVSASMSLLFVANRACR